ncbi:MAG: hypothetical protein SO016_11565 [Lachnospiraceae bacterium]|nr:hypothetical protein [Robinsoniella sp.]MDY3767303.1 hypothetical protein [Lachnospiraceae bacterium]
MIDGKKGVTQMIAQQREEQEALQRQIAKLYGRYQTLEEIEREYRKEEEAFSKMIHQTRAGAQKIAQTFHPPHMVGEFSNCLAEKLYGSEYEMASDNIKEIGEKISEERRKIQGQIDQEETRQRMLEQRIASLERLLGQ